MNLRDDTEIEISEERVSKGELLPWEPEYTPESAAPSAKPVDSETPVPFSRPAPAVADVDRLSEDKAIVGDETSATVIKHRAASHQSVETKPVAIATTSPFKTKPQFVSRPVDVEAEAEVDSLFFVDTEPEPALVKESPFYLDTAPGPSSSTLNKPLYKSEIRPALGHAPCPASSDEEIVFAPRQFKQPQPIQVNMSQASGSRPTRNRPSPPAATSAPSHPRAMSRAQKKAAKKDKKKGGSKKLQRSRRQAEIADTSDIEWGSDGPPRGKNSGIEGIDESDEENDDDVAILQDYLAGTLLNAKQSSDEDMDADQDMDSDEVDEALQLDMMRRFGEGVSQWDPSGIVASGSASGSDDDPVMGEEEEMDGDESDSDVLEIEIDNYDESNSDTDSSEDGGEDNILDRDTEADIDRQLAMALAKGEEDSDIEELFTGKQAWGNEEDWFLQSMTVSIVYLAHLIPSMAADLQDALDPKAVSYKNRKSNSKLFHAIENGNFHDFDLAVGKFISIQITICEDTHL